MDLHRFLRRFNKAEYIFRPAQFFRRFSHPTIKPDGKTSATLAWGQTFEISPHEDIGRAILRLGLYDLTVSEVIFRLCQLPSQNPRITLDVGANIGYMSAVLSHSLKSNDVIHSFEPHPEIFRRLNKNTNLMKGPLIKTHELALSDSLGKMKFMLPANWAENEGTGFLLSSETEGKAGSASFLKEVETSTLDHMMSEQKISKIHLLKVDTEGNEISVLRGATLALQQKLIDHVIYEDHRAYPNDVSQILEDNGYHVFFLKRGFLGPRILEARDFTPENWEPNSYLATLQPDIVRKLVSASGWKILR